MHWQVQSLWPGYPSYYHQFEGQWDAVLEKMPRICPEQRNQIYNIILCTSYKVSVPKSH